MPISTTLLNTLAAKRLRVIEDEEDIVDDIDEIEEEMDEEDPQQSIGADPQVAMKLLETYSAKHELVASTWNPGDPFVTRIFDLSDF